MQLFGLWYKSELFLLARCSYGDEINGILYEPNSSRLLFLLQDHQLLLMQVEIRIIRQKANSSNSNT